VTLDTTKYDIALSDSRWDRVLFGLEHRLLSPGTSDTARLRGYLRVKEWREARSLRERLHRLRVAAKLPARAVRSARAAVRAHGDWVRQEAGVSPRRQFLHLWWLAVRHGIVPEVYYAYRLYRPGQLGRAPHFLQHPEATRFFRLLCARTCPDELELLQSKGAFEAWLVERGLPTVRTLVEFAHGTEARTWLPDGRLPRVDLFSKPDDSLGGRGTQRWPFDGERWVDLDGRGLTEAELRAELAGRVRGGGAILLQERMRNHHLLTPLAPATLSTVRIITLRDRPGQPPHVVLGVAKIPTGDAAADHMRLGGVAAPIDVDTGRLGTAVRPDARTVVAPVDRHPDTGATIPGFQLPLWEEAKALAVRAHAALPRIICVGWDIALLEDGPIIVEGNSSPGGKSSQLPSGVGMGETPIIRALRAGVHASFADGGTPTR
jgi:hypothetical protein